MGAKCARHLTNHAVKFLRGIVLTSLRRSLNSVPPFNIIFLCRGISSPWLIDVDSVAMHNETDVCARGVEGVYTATRPPATTPCSNWGGPPGNIVCCSVSSVPRKTHYGSPNSEFPIFARLEFQV